ncbi:hypothetical protein Q4S57_14855 [Priestia megaterium]|uniref:hypothetical protein n=1 Tax=Priestia megaterium TaxID=1404 RepID=UPI0026E1997F|nr:hypothetical protein [Priestia megaterium]MDO6849238.1 hypothetical protein [Priestia megaterium]
MCRFDIETLKKIRDDLQEIHSTAISNYHDYHDYPELMDTIDHLARVANMFANDKIESLENNNLRADPQGYIVSKLSSASSHMKNYKKGNDKRKEGDYDD